MNMMKRYLPLILAVHFALFLVAPSRAEWSLLGLGSGQDYSTNAGNISRAVDISADGSTILLARGPGTPGRNARWRDGQLEVLPEGDTYFPPAASVLSADGHVVAGYYVARSYDRIFHPLRIEGTEWVQLTEPQGYSFIVVDGLSADGSVMIGEAREYPESLAKALRWEDDEFEFLEFPGLDVRRSHANTITPDGNVIYGHYLDSSQQFRSYRWEAGVAVDLGIAGIVRFISDDGVVWGGSLFNPATGEYDLARFENGQGTLLELFDGATFTRLNDLSADGAVLVGISTGDLEDSWDPNLIAHPSYPDCPTNIATIWTEDGGIQSLQSMLEGAGLDLSDWQLAEATAISADGTKIVGYGWHRDGTREAFLATIPEPGTFTLLATLALPGLWLMWRRRR